MSAPIALEREILAGAEEALTRGLRNNRSSDIFDRRLDVLDAAAAEIGGFDLSIYRERCIRKEPKLSLAQAMTLAKPVVAEIARTPIAPALALSALAREPLPKHVIRTAGAHYTDFRLALLIGRLAAKLNGLKRPLLDPASGTGMLLSAASIVACESGHSTAKWLAENVIAADQSLNALRGAQLSLASLTDDIGAIIGMSSRWLHGDSLIRSRSEWDAVIGGQLGAIVANPPWEKLKVLRHEHEIAGGVVRHYGAAHLGAAGADLKMERARVRQYADLVVDRYPLSGRGETDLFVAFTQMMIELADEGAGIAALLPAGLIRSKSTTLLRKLLFSRFGRVSFTILDNKPRFFEIDTRFKFVAMTAQPSNSEKATGISIGYGQADATGCKPGPSSKIDVGTLTRLRPDLSIPEVRSVEEWKLFQRMMNAGQAWVKPSSTWWPRIVREVDMTRERSKFLAHPTANAVPLIEGRMIHQFRFGAKSYVGGSGRRSTWAPVPLGTNSVEPQFWIGRSDLPRSALERVDTMRAGFCDIAGQTNERSMMAAVVPPGVSCGNKVPTVTFPNLPGEDALHLWCGIVNSFAFDWMLRRVITTTVNYFLLQSVPLPPLLPSTLPGRRVAMDARQAAALSSDGEDDPAIAIAELRRNIDLACFRAYGLRPDEIALLLRDFPSLDRGEPPLPGESRSTITRDFILSAIETPDKKMFGERLDSALRLGARPYRPSHLISSPRQAIQLLHTAT